MDNGDKYVAPINMLAIVKQKESPFFHSTVDNRVTFSANNNILNIGIIQL